MNSAPAHQSASVAQPETQVPAPVQTSQAGAQATSGAQGSWGEPVTVKATPPMVQNNAGAGSWDNDGGAAAPAGDW